MTVYTNSAISASGTWQGLIEAIWQTLPGYSLSLPSWKRTDIGLSERLFIGAVLNLPREQRQWGVVSWLGEVMEVSRPTLYAIGEWARSALLPGSMRGMGLADPDPAVQAASREKTITVTPNRIRRTALTLMLPGGVPDRSSEVCLQIALDESRSVGFQSGLAHEAGVRAGEILKGVNHAAMGAVMQARDELFVGRDPILLMVEPHSLVITGLYAAEHRDAETWGCVLLFTQDRGVQIQGLAEDGCIPYAASCKAAQLDAAIQKDVWHPLNDVSKVIHDLEREANQTLKLTEALEKKQCKHWQDAVFAEWLKPYEKLEHLLAQIKQLTFWHGCLWDAVELVDWRNGEISTRAIHQWLAEETLRGIQQLPHPRIQKLAQRLAEQLPEMLTFLDTILEPMSDWQAQAAQHFQDHASVSFFQASVARFWRLEHAVLHNGQNKFRNAALDAQQWLAA